MKGGLPKRPYTYFGTKRTEHKQIFCERANNYETSTIDQLELQRRDEILSEIEVKGWILRQSCECFMVVLDIQIYNGVDGRYVQNKYHKKDIVTCKFFKCFFY